MKDNKMKTLRKLIRRFTTNNILGMMALTLATYGTLSTMADTSRPDACRDRLVKLGDIDKEGSRDKENDLGLAKMEDGVLGKVEDGCLNKVEDGALGAKSDGSDLGVDTL